MTSYRDAGVDIEAGHRAVALMKDAVEATHGPEVLGGLGRFGGLFSAAGLGGSILVASTDGVGTKTRVAAALRRWDTIGQDIVNHCVNDVLVQGAEPLFFLDYVASAKLDPEVIAAVVGGAALACRQAGCALLGGETAEMPGVYHDGELDLVGTIVGAVAKEALIDGSRIEVGDVVMAVGSVGLHTNGFSLARKALEGLDFLEHRDDLGCSLADALLVPHRSYLSEFRALRDAGIDQRGLVHITGGGLIENPPRIIDDHLAFSFDRSSWEIPPLFQLIAKRADVAEREMARTFNLGLGMLWVIPKDDVARFVEAVPEAIVVAEITERDTAPVVFHG